MAKRKSSQGQVVVAKNGNDINRIKEMLVKGNPTEEVSVSSNQLKIAPLRERVVELAIEGTSPLMMLRFSQKALHKMMETQKAGSQAKSKRNREARNFEEDFKGASYRLADGSGYGIPCISFRHALKECCRLVNYKMTIAKQTLFIEPDGFDSIDGQPLVRIISPEEPKMTVMPVRNATGVMDLRARPMWEKWGCNLRVRFDVDHFSLDDIVNLVIRAGAQNGMGEGRVNSKEGPGPGYGAFRVCNID